MDNPQAKNTPINKLEPANPVQVTVYVSNMGDCDGADGYVNFPDFDVQIEAIRLECGADIIEYCVKYYNGAWSDWVPRGTFLGNRGEGVPLMGLALRLIPPFGKEFVSTTSVRFMDGSIQTTFAEDRLYSFDKSPIAGLHISLTSQNAMTDRPQ